MKQRCSYGLCAAILVILLLPASGGAAPASNQEMHDLSPANYAILTPVSSVEVQFSCPSYGTTYAGIKDWTSYYVHFATSPIRSIEGDFSSRYEVGTERASLLPGTANTCRAFLAEPYTETPDTYYWFAERINCDANYCAQFSPLSSFSIVKPIPPGGSGKQPRGSTGGVKYVNTYVGCGIDKEVEPAKSCSRFDRMGAFFESNQPTRFKLCIGPPKGRSHCASRQAKADTLYVKRIAAREPGRYKVSWSFEGRTTTRNITSSARAGREPKRKLFLSYGKAQAEAQKAASDFCNSLDGCQYWAASCARNSSSNLSCTLSTWSPSIPGFPVPWIRCDSEEIVKATKFEVQAKPAADSNQCYSSPD